MKKILAIAILLVILLLWGGCNVVGLDDELKAAREAAFHGDYEEAMRHTDLCLGIAPKNVDALLIHGFCQYSSTTAGALNKASALRNLEKATKLAPDRLDAWLFYGWALYNNGMSHEAIEPLERALALAPADSRHRGDIMLMLGRCCVHNNLQQKAMNYLQPLRVRKPYNQWPEIYNSLGMLALHRGERQKALDNFSKAYALSPNNPDLLQNIAVTFDLHLQRPDLARRYYIKTLAALNGSPDQARKLRLQNRLAHLPPTRK
jgi:tetratricopeptide (TPR) repeat protein